MFLKYALAKSNPYNIVLMGDSHVYSITYAWNANAYFRSTTSVQTRTLDWTRDSHNRSARACLNAARQDFHMKPHLDEMAILNERVFVRTSRVSFRGVRRVCPRDWWLVYIPLSVSSNGTGVFPMQRTQANQWHLSREEIRHRKVTSLSNQCMIRSYGTLRVTQLFIPRLLKSRTLREEHSDVRFCNDRNFWSRTLTLWRPCEFSSWRFEGLMHSFVKRECLCKANTVIVRTQLFESVMHCLKMDSLNIWPARALFKSTYVVWVIKLEGHISVKCENGFLIGQCVNFG